MRRLRLGPLIDCLGNSLDQWMIRRVSSRGQRSPVPQIEQKRLPLSLQDIRPTGSWAPPQLASRAPRRIHTRLAAILGKISPGVRALTVGMPLQVAVPAERPWAPTLPPSAVRWSCAWWSGIRAITNSPFHRSCWSLAQHGYLILWWR